LKAALWVAKLASIPKAGLAYKHSLDTVHGFVREADFSSSKRFQDVEGGPKLELFPSSVPPLTVAVAMGWGGVLGSASNWGAWLCVGVARLDVGWGVVFGQALRGRLEQWEREHQHQRLAQSRLKGTNQTTSNLPPPTRSAGGKARLANGARAPPRVSGMGTPPQQ